MDLFLSMRSVACIQFSGSSQPATKENAPFSHSQNRKFFSDRRNGETPDKIGGFLGNIFFIAHRWCGRQELNLHGCPPVPKTGVSAIPPRPRIHIIVIKTGKRRTHSGIHYSILITTSQRNIAARRYIFISGRGYI